MDVCVEWPIVTCQEPPPIGHHVHFYESPVSFNSFLSTFLLLGDTCCFSCPSWPFCSTVQAPRRSASIYVRSTAAAAAATAPTTTNGLYFNHRGLFTADTILINKTFIPHLPFMNLNPSTACASPPYLHPLLLPSLPGRLGPSYSSSPSSSPLYPSSSSYQPI